MSVRAIAIRSGPHAPVAAFRAAAGSAGLLSPVRVTAATQARPARRRRRYGSPLTAFADDRRLIGVKLILIGLLYVAVMALEVPW